MIRSITGTAQEIKKRIKEQLNNQDDAKPDHGKDQDEEVKIDKEEEKELDIEAMKEKKLRDILESRKNNGISGYR